MPTLFDPAVIPGAMFWSHLPYYFAAAAMLALTRVLRHKAERFADSFERAVERRIRSTSEGKRTP